MSCHTCACVVFTINSYLHPSTFTTVNVCADDSSKREKLSGHRAYETEICIANTEKTRIRDIAAVLGFCLACFFLLFLRVSWSGNRKEATERVDSFTARLSSREPGTYAARASPRGYECDYSSFVFAWRYFSPPFFRYFVISICLSFYFFFVLKVIHHTLPEPARHMRGHRREKGFICVVCY